MNGFSNTQLTDYAKELRKNMTNEERHLWYDFSKEIPIKFHRQKVIGNYIVDFYCSTAKIVIELDGSQHFEKEEKNKDKIRDEYLKSLGMRVLRYTNLEIHKNFSGVCQDILNKINE